MTIDDKVRLIAGGFVLVSVGLSFWLSPWWLLLAAFVGGALVQSAFTCICPVARILKKFES